jgi:hypothetical protein
MFTAGLVGTLATAGMENSRSDFWAIAMTAAGTGVSGSVVGGVAEEEEAWDPFFLRSASGFGMKLSGKSKPLMHYPVNLKYYQGIVIYIFLVGRHGSKSSSMDMSKIDIHA